MTTVCQAALLEIQYFVARDFRLDSQLYKHCSEDAVKHCHAPKNWISDVTMIGPLPNPLILPCLYRYSHHPDGDVKLSPKCSDEVRRVMTQRANSVRLIPQVHRFFRLHRNFS